MLLNMLFVVPRIYLTVVYFFTLESVRDTLVKVAAKPIPALAAALGIVDVR